MAGGALAFVHVMFALASLSTGQELQLIVTRSDHVAGSPSVVELACRAAGFVFDLDGAQFQRNGTDIRIGSNRVTIILNEGTGTIRFSFTRQQEGDFTCTHQTSTSTSNAISLAAAPSVDYSSVQRDRYITFPSPDSQRTITLDCDIQPGLLTNRYRVEWSKQSDTGLILLPNSGSYELNIAVLPTDVFYRCTVHIQHRSDNNDETAHLGPKIILHKAVLTKIRVNNPPIRHKTATEGESVNFTCSFSLDQNVDLDIQWAVDGTNYSSCDLPAQSNGCFTDRTESTTTTSVLTIDDTSSLTPGNHTVQCSAIQSLHDNFTNDPSYDDSATNDATNANAVQSSATLTIIQVDSPTVTMTSSVTETPTATPTSSTDGISSSPPAVAIGAGAAVGILLLVVVVLVILVVIFCYLRKKGDGDPEGKGTRCFAWKPKHDVETGDGSSQPNETYEMKQPEIHVPQNKQFHSGDTPELRRQNARPNGSKNNSLDPLEPIYNVSMISAVSGESALTDDGSLSNPPSPTVSDIHNGEEESPSDRYLSQPGPSSFEGPGDHHHYQHHDHHYDGQGYYDQHPEHSYDSRNYAPSQASSFGIHNMFEGYSQSGYGSQPVPYSESSRYPSVYQEPSHHGYDQQSSLDIPFDGGRIGSTSSVHSDRTHSTKHSKGSSRSGKSSRSGRSDRLDVEQEHSRRHSASPHLPRERHHHRHSPSSHHSDRHSSHHSDHHSSRERSPRSRSPRPAFEPAHFTQEYPTPSHHQSHHVLATGHILPPRGPPMRPTRSAEWVKPPQYYHQQPQEQLLYQQPPLQTERHHSNEPDMQRLHSNEPDTAPSNGSNISEDVLLTAIGCLMHQEDCQIPNCSCKRVKEKFIHLLPKTRSHMHKEAGKVIEESQRGDFDPTGRRQQMRISLASQDISKDIHPHYHMTSRSHIRQSDGRQRFLQRRRSRSMDLTPVVELPESCATTPGVVIPDRAKGLLCGHMFSPAMTPTGESFRVLSPTASTLNTIAPPVLLREISLSADNLPALCLNDCPMAVTPMTQLGNRALGTSAARSPLSTTQRRWSVGPVNSPLPSLIEKDSPTSSEEGPSDRYTSQDSSSSLQTTSTQSSGPSGQSGKSEEEEASVFGDSIGFCTQSSTSTSATNPEESVKLRQYFAQRGKQNDDSDSVLPNESGYSTSIDTVDSESTSLRSRLPPADLPISPPQVPPKQKNMARVPEQQKHLVPIVSNGTKRIQRTGSTSSHGSHASHLSVASHASVASHISQASDGSVTTQTLC